MRRRANLRTSLPVAALASLGLAGADARADAIDDLQPGTWYEIPDTPMRDVCPPDTAAYDWSFYCANAIAAWNGGVLDTQRGRLIVWGGGHGDYKGNEVYAFDLHTLEWTRIWGPTPDEQIPSGGTHEEYDDGNPGSRHTYSGLAYVPTHDVMVTMGGSLWQSGFYAAGVWRFDFETESWTRMADGPGEQGYGDPTVFDPQTGHVFRRSNSRMLEYDPDADMFIDRAPSDGGFWTSNVSAALDLGTRTMVIAGDERIDLYHLDTDLYDLDVTIDGLDPTALFGGNSPGIAYDTQTEQVVLWAGGLDVYALDPEALTLSMHEGAGDDPGEISPSGGAFGRFRYAPSRNVFVYVDHADSNVFVFRMSEGTGVPPDPPGGTGSTTDGGSSSGADDGTGGSPGSDGTPGDASNGSTTSTATGGESGGADEDDGGCSCRSTAPPRSLGILLLAGLIAAPRRQQRRRAAQ